MPMLDEATTVMSMKMSSPNVAATAADATLFAQLPLPAAYIYPDDALKRRLLQVYLNALPPGIQETIRATIYFALTSKPPRPIKFGWAGAYDYKLELTETYDTFHSPRTPGVIGLTLHGRYPDDPHPLADRIAAQGVASGRSSSSKRGGKGGAKPTKRKASKRS